MNRIAIRFFAALMPLVLFMGANPQAFAQEQGDLAEQIRRIVDPLVQNEERISKRLESQEADERELNRLREELKLLVPQSLEALKPLQADIFDLFRRLERIPAPPKEGETEPPEISLERQTLSEQKARIVLAIKDAELVSLSARESAEAILEQRRTRFIGRLFQRYSVDAQTFITARNELPTIFERLGRALQSWSGFAVSTRFKSFGLIVLIALAALAALIFADARFRRRTGKEKRREEHALAKVMDAFFSIILPGTGFAAIALFVHLSLFYLDLYRFSMADLLPSLLLVLCGLVFEWLLLRAILAPFAPQSRLVPIKDGAAKILSGLYMLMALVFALDVLAGEAFDLFSTDFEVTIVKSIATAMMIAVLLTASLCVRVRENQSQGESQYAPRGWPVFFFWAIAALIAIIWGCLFSGYIGLGNFIAEQIILSGSVLALAYLGLRAAAALAEPKTLEMTAMGANIKRRSGMSDMKMDQLGLLSSVLIKTAIVIATLPLLALQWGYSLDQISEWAILLLTGFSIGGFEFSIGRILIAVLIAVALVMAIKGTQNWVEGKVFPRTKFDSGVKNSLRSGIGYLGYMIAAIIGLSAAGVQLSNIALIAGALSLGIGFGLQNIVNNFVSGLIMLIERPVKVGDIIAVAGTEGYVRKINVRATELETFDRQSVIIPNSEVINTAVGNWMHKARDRRVIVNIGVAYGSDVEKVRDILTDLAKDHPLILPGSEPFVYFKDFGASSLDFELRVIIRNIDDTLVVENDLRFAIVKKLEEHNIEIPFPQRDVHIRSGLEGKGKELS